MLLGKLLDLTELDKLIQSKHIRIQTHPTLPLIIYNYSNECMFEDFWPETVQICRGLITTSSANYDEREVISRPFHKFFNLNQSTQSDYHEANLPKVTPTVTEKMDGWFGSMWKYEDKYGIASRGSFTSPGAEFGTTKLQKLVKYGAVDEFPKGYTPIFEIIFRAGKIVVEYPFEGLVLLGCVSNDTGEELPYSDLKEIHTKITTYSADERPWIRLVNTYPIYLQDCLLHSEKNFEGFVLSYPRPGTWPIKVKVKLEEYKRLHKLITGITPQQIWKSLHNPMAQWLDAEIPDHFRTWAVNWRNSLMRQFDEKLQKSHYWVDEMHGSYKSQPRVQLLNDLNEQATDVSTIVLALLDGKVYEAYQAIWNTIRPVGREDVFYREGAGE